MNVKSMSKEQGFTLIELIVVIIILGILAATALPKFIDLKQNASDAAAQGVAGGLTAAFATNYAGYVVGGTAKGVAVSAAAQDVLAAANSVMMGGMPTGYSVSPSTVACGTAGLAVAITVSGPAPATAQTATLICTG